MRRSTASAATGVSRRLVVPLLAGAINGDPTTATTPDLGDGP